MMRRSLGEKMEMYDRLPAETRRAVSSMRAIPSQALLETATKYLALGYADTQVAAAVRSLDDDIIAGRLKQT